MLGLGQSGAVGEFGLELAEFGHGAVESAFVSGVEFRQILDFEVQRAGGEVASASCLRAMRMFQKA